MFNLCFVTLSKKSHLCGGRSLSSPSVIGNYYGVWCPVPKNLQFDWTENEFITLSFCMNNLIDNVFINIIYTNKTNHAGRYTASLTGGNDSQALGKLYVSSISHLPLKGTPDQQREHPNQCLPRLIHRLMLLRMCLPSSFLTPLPRGIFP